MTVTRLGFCTLLAGLAFAAWCCLPAAPLPASLADLPKPRITLDTVAQYGGGLQAVAGDGERLVAGVGPRIVVLEDVGAAAMTVVDRSLPLPAVIRVLETHAGRAYVLIGDTADRVVPVNSPTATSLRSGPASRSTGVTDEMSHAVFVLDTGRPGVPLLARIDTAGEPVALATVPDGDRLYVANRLDEEGSGGHLQVFDVRDPAHVAELGRLPIGRPLELSVAGALVYVLSSHVDLPFAAPGDIEVIDAGEARRLRSVGTLELPAQLGRWADILALGGIAYVATGNISPGLVVADVRDPSNMRVLTTFVAPANSLATAGGFLYAFEVTGVSVYDVSDPARPLSRGAIAGIAQLGAIVGNRLATMDGVGTLHLRGLVNGTTTTDDRTWQPELAATGRLFAQDAAVIAVDSRGRWVETGESAVAGQPNIRVVDLVPTISDSSTYQPVPIGPQPNRWLVTEFSSHPALLFEVDRSDPASALAGQAVSLPFVVSDVAADGARSFLASEPGELLAFASGYPREPVLLGRLRLSVPGRRLTVAAGQAYLANSKGLMVVDVADPAAMRTRNVLPGPPAKAIASRGRWLATANADTVRLYRLDDPQEPALVAERILPEAVEVALDDAFLYVLSDDVAGAAQAHLIPLADPRGANITSAPLLGQLAGMAVTRGELVVATYGAGLLWLRPRIESAYQVWLPAVQR